MSQMIEPQAAGKHLQQFICPTNIMAQNLTKKYTLKTHRVTWPEIRSR